MLYPEALDRLKEGNRVRRRCWHEGCFAYLVPGSQFTVNRAPLLGIFPEGTEITYRPHIDRMYADGTFGVFLPADDDMLAKDWELADHAPPLRGAQVEMQLN